MEEETSVPGALSSAAPPPPPATISGEEVPAASEAALGEDVAMTITRTTMRSTRPMTSQTLTFSHHAFFFSFTACKGGREAGRRLVNRYLDSSQKLSIP